MNGDDTFLFENGEKLRMKILLLSNPDDPHTLKWVKELAKKDIEIILFGFNRFDESIYEGFSNITLYSGGLSKSFIRSKIGGIKKLKYLTFLKTIKELIHKHNPDIIHAHYISSYGLLGALLKHKPFFVSAWGRDVFVFPRISFLHRLIIKFIFKKSSQILSTSHAMKREILKYTKKDVHVIPFGIQLDRFQPLKRIGNNEIITIGTVKKLYPVYGIEYLIRAFSRVQSELKDRKILLKIVGDGPLRKILEDLARDLQISHLVHFEGEVSPEKVPEKLHQFDIFSALSIVESFGVAVIEASACGLPVVVSNTGGLPEVVENGKTGFIVQQRNVDEAADALIKLIQDVDLRNRMGEAGRHKIEAHYNWKNNLDKMVQIYNEYV